MYHPDGLIRQAKANGQPIIYVGINYRVGSKLVPSMGRLSFAD